MFTFIVGIIVGFVYFTTINEVGMIKIARNFLDTARAWDEASEKLHAASIKELEAAKAYHNEALLYRDEMKKFDDNSKEFIRKAIASYDEAQQFLNKVKGINTPTLS